MDLHFRKNKQNSVVVVPDSVAVRDGTGTGISARVDDEHRLWTRSLVTNEADFLNFSEDAYGLTSNVIKLLNANESAVFYMKNTGQITIVVFVLAFMLGTSENGKGAALVSVVRNPTGGTLITSGIDGVVFNRNFGSIKPVDIVHKAAVNNGLTLTGGDKIPFNIIMPGQIQRPQIGEMIIPKNSSIGVTIKPSANNTEMDVMVGIGFYAKA
jgi:hypothetical protein